MRVVAIFLTLGIILSALLGPAEGGGAASEPESLADIIVNGFDQPLRIRLVVTSDGVPWRTYFNEMRRRSVQSLFQQLDADDDGRLKGSEAKRLPSAGTFGEKHKGERHIAFNFLVLDANRDGSASVEELANYLSDFGDLPLRMTMAEQGRATSSRDLFDVLDADHDDRLGKPEWSNIAAIFDRDRDGNRVLTMEELQPPLANVFGPEFVAKPLAAGNLRRSLTFTLATPTATAADVSIFVRYSSASVGRVFNPSKIPDGLETQDGFEIRPTQAEATPPGGPGYDVPTVEVKLSDQAKHHGLDLKQIDRDAVVLQCQTHRIELSLLPPAFRRDVQLRQAILREFEAVAQLGGGEVAVPGDLPPTLKSIVSVADSDGNGKVNRAEVDRCLNQFVATSLAAEPSRLKLTVHQQRGGLATLIDRNLDGRLGHREISRLPRELEALAGGSSPIGRDDLPTTISLVLQRGPFDDASGNDAPLSAGPPWFFRADRNQDGDLDLSEFYGATPLFDRLDANRDGWIDLAEAIRGDMFFSSSSSGGGLGPALGGDDRSSRAQSPARPLPATPEPPATAVKRPSGPTAASVPPQDVSNQIDALFEHSLPDADFGPVTVADDATFLRRVTLDLTGIIPEIGEVRKFLADDGRDKRSRWIDHLLDRPRHATHLANVWREVLLPRGIPESTSAGFENWLQVRFRENVPYHSLVREILLARGSLSQSPPALYYVALDSKPAALAASASQVFLGVQIRCAECHDHPFTAWKQDDFWSLAAFFARVRGPSQNGGPAEVDDGPSGEVRHPKTNKTVPPRLLDGSPVSLTTDEPRRAILVRWMTARDNPYFARAAVNRVWWVMFGRGLVEPVDDFGGHNPAAQPEVLDLLTRDFIDHGYDLRRVFRIIANTRVYQRSSVPVAGDGQPPQAYTSMPVRSLSAEEIYDCLFQAAGRRDPLDRNDPRIAQQRGTFLAQVDAPTRKATEFQGGIPQTLAMLNGPFVNELTNPSTGDLVAALVDSPFLSDQQRIETLYLATLTRLPRDEEVEQSLTWIKSCDAEGDKAQGFSDILWALLNSSEFVLKR